MVPIICSQKADNRYVTIIDGLCYPLFNVTHTTAKPLLVTVELNQVPTDMEVDTGASVLLISKETL